MRRGIITFCFVVGLSGQTTIKDTSPRTLASQTYAQLGTPPDGTVVYCTNCIAASPTAAGGTGVVVKRENGIWNGGGGGGGGATSTAPGGLTITGALYGVGESSTLIESNSAGLSDSSSGVYRKIKHSGSRTPVNNGNSYGIFTQIGIYGGSNYYETSTGTFDKKTQGGEAMYINFAGSGQKAGHAVTVVNAGMGDSYGYDSVQYVDGHFDAAGDEVVGGQYRGFTIQQPTEFTGAITSSSRPTCNTTTTAAIVKSTTATDFVTVPVGSTANCAAGDWITFAISRYFSSGYTTTVARINTIVDATHFTAIVQHAQPSGVTVTPCTRLVVAGMTTDYRDSGLLGQGRLAIITDGPTYTTGQIDGAADSGSGYWRVTAKAGSGVNWTTNMVGGDANGIGLLCPDIDKFTTASSVVAHACWPILQLDGDSQHLRVYNYNGQMAPSGGSYTYTIYPGTRIEWLETTATSSDLTMTAVILRNNSFAWTAGKTFVQPLDPWLTLSYQHSAFCKIDGPIGPNAPCGTSYQAINEGKAMGLAAFRSRGRGDANPDWVYGLSVGGNTQAGGIVISGKDSSGIGINLGNASDLKKISWQGGANPNGVSNIYSSSAGFVIDNFDSKLNLRNTNTGGSLTLDYSSMGPFSHSISFPAADGSLLVAPGGRMPRTIPATADVSNTVDVGRFTNTGSQDMVLEAYAFFCGSARRYSVPLAAYSTGTSPFPAGAFNTVLPASEQGSSDYNPATCNYSLEVRIGGDGVSSGFADLRLRNTVAGSGAANGIITAQLYGDWASITFVESTTASTSTPPTQTTAATVLVQRNNVATVNGKLALATVAAYTCDATTRGQFNYIAGAAGAKDIVQVCAKAADNSYAWRPIY